MIALVAGVNLAADPAVFPVCGALADSFDRRHVMLVAQAVMLVVSLGLIAASWADVLTPWTLLTLYLPDRDRHGAEQPSWQASVGDLVPREQVPEAVSLNGIGFNLMRSVGPAVGGAIVATFGAAVAFAVNAVCYLPFIAALLRWNPSARTNPCRASPLSPPSALACAMLPCRPRSCGCWPGRSCSALALWPACPVAHRRPQSDAGRRADLWPAAGRLWHGRNRRRRHKPPHPAKAQRRGRGAGGFPWLCRGCGGAFPQPHPVDRPARNRPGRGLLGAGAVAVQCDRATVVAALGGGPGAALYQMATFGGMAMGSWVWGMLAGGIGLPVTLALASATLPIGSALGWFCRCPALARPTCPRPTSSACPTCIWTCAAVLARSW